MSSIVTIESRYLYQTKPNFLLRCDRWKPPADWKDAKSLTAKATNGWKNIKHEVSAGNFSGGLVSLASQKAALQEKLKLSRLRQQEEAEKLQETKRAKDLAIQERESRTQIVQERRGRSESGSSSPPSRRFIMDDPRKDAKDDGIWQDGFNAYFSTGSPGGDVAQKYVVKA